ncbi:MAG: hypothetical protein NTZ87_00520 [Candidatus Nomurabacteria bacterium]|nr:hypothetical protein [Candidatus Nomurabacteria bacterium]
MKDKRKLYAEKKAQKQTRHLILTFFGIIAVIIMGATYFNSRATMHVEALSTELVPSQYSLQEMREFWTNHFQGTFDKGLFVNRYPLPKIQERYNFVTKCVTERFHTNFNLKLDIGYMPEGKQILAGSGVVDGFPTVEIIVPELMDIYRHQQQKNEPGWEERMCRMIVSSVIHEFDHLAFCNTNGTRAHPNSLDQLVENECKAWSYTCEYTIRSFIEDYGVSTGDTDEIFYDNWLKAHRNADSPLWRNFIREHYKKTR